MIYPNPHHTNVGYTPDPHWTWRPRNPRNLPRSQAEQLGFLETEIYETLVEQTWDMGCFERWEEKRKGNHVIGFQSNSVGFRGISWGKPLGKKTDKVEKHHGFLAIGIHLGAQWEVGGGRWDQIHPEGNIYIWCVLLSCILYEFWIHNTWFKSKNNINEQLHFFKI